MKKGSGETTVREKKGVSPQGQVLPRLVCVRGAGEGREYFFQDNEIRIGRAKGNTIVVDQDDISRLHAVIHVRGEDYVLEDLGSRNGTFVNGQHVMEKKLVPDDRIQVGEAVFRFEVARPEEASPASPSKADYARADIRRPASHVWRRVGVTGVIVAGVVAAGGAVWFGHRQPAPTPAPLSSHDAPPSLQEVVRQHFTRGVAGYSKGKWQEAIEEFDQVLSLDPAHQEAKTYRAASERRQRMSRQLAKAEDTVQAGDVPGALRMAREMVKEDPEFGEAKSFLERVEKRAGDLEKVDGTFRQAQTAYQRGDLERAASLFQQVPPGHEKYAEAQRYVKKVIPSRVEAQRSYRDGLAAYQRGDAPQALAAFDRAGASDSSLERMRAVIEHYGKARLSEKREDWLRLVLECRAIRALEKDPQNFFFRYASQRQKEIQPEVSILVKKHYENGVMSRKNGDLTAALKEFLLVAEVDSSHREAQGQLTQLKGYMEKEAERLYREGYVLRETDLPAAITRWEKVMEITPPDHPYYKKAHDQISKARTQG